MFGASKGIRQRDPLSPFLLTLAVNGLSRMVTKAIKAGLFKGILVGKDKVEVYHLQFVNDALNFQPFKSCEPQSTWAKV